MSDPFHWAERVSRRDIRRLYESDAQGMLDMQGVPRMPVGQNVIQGTTEQVRELIETLAYGPGNTQGLSSPEDWRAVYYDPVRLFK